jgi:AraC-like DNA-binding protein
MTKTPNVNVTETAMKTGFDDSSYFAKKFKKFIEISPMAFLKERREDIR